MLHPFDRMQALLKRHAGLSRLLPVVLALVCCWLVTGGSMLAPGNILWLQHADLAQSYLGWAFYRHDPWTLPPGATPSYGLDFHSSVYYSDSIPLLAMALKPIAAWLPEPFQYFGLWVALCFVLQGLMAWRLVGIATPHPLARAAGCLFFLLAPPMLVRLGGHMALFGQWMILAALLIHLQPSPRQRTRWTLLMAAAMVVHAYLFFMVAAIWAADLFDRTLDAARTRRASWRPVGGLVLTEMAQVIAATAVAAWLAGFFMVPGKDGGSDGFGYYKMNLLAVFDGAGWSALGLRAQQAPGEYEGFNYLGAGGIMLCLIAIPAWLRTRRERTDTRRLWPLAAIAALLILAAITPHVGLGALQWQMPLPVSLWQRLTHLPIQSTGRLFWVPYYALLTGAIVVLARALPSRAFVTVLVLLAALQLWDLAPGISNLRQMLTARAQASNLPPLTGPFWASAGQRYHRLRLFPPRIVAPGWERLAFYANDHGMGTDAIQVARANWKQFNRSRDTQARLLADGKPEPDTLYVLDAGVADGVIHALGPDDAVFELDGLIVLAPGWGPTLPAGARDLKVQVEGSTHTAVP